jgi:hypothetical protein
VPDDRFADLGSGTRAGDRLAELDRTQPEPRPEPPRRRANYTWVVGVAAVVLIVFVTITSLRHQGRGSNGPIPGKPLPRFAAPSATSSLDGNPNIKQNPSDNGVSNKTPACDVRLPGAIRSCDYMSKPLVITFIVPTGECEAYLDRVDRLRQTFPRVNFLAVVSGPKDRAAAAARDHGWREPVASDNNGAILSLYRAPPYCATNVFAYRGGTVRSTKTSAQTWSDAQLQRVIRALEQG